MTKSEPKTCFDKQKLVDYLDEKLDEFEEAEIQKHIGSCSQCQKQLEAYAANETIWKDVREIFPSEIEEPDPEDSRLKRLLEILGPTDDPTKLGRLGNYEVCGVIGHGSTGVVLKAYETRLNRFVAIKVLSPTFNSKGAARQRFEREARAVAAVQHENIVPIFAVDDHQGWPYFVMQYVPGLSLLQRIDKFGPLDTDEVSRIGIQVAKGLAAAHRQGVIHRDVKPENVMLESTVDRAMVTDFGLARLADDVSMTQSGVIAGTPSYMSPEQAKGELVDARSDLFSLGSLMYAACTARPPFRADTIYGVINRVCNTEPRAIREINPRIDSWLSDFIVCLMSKDRDTRFQSADEVADLLSTELAYLQNPQSAPKPVRTWQSKLEQPVPESKKLKNAKQPSSWSLPMVTSVLLVGLCLLAVPFSESLKQLVGLGDKPPGNYSDSPSMNAGALSHSGSTFFSQEQDFEVKEEPTVTWKPMEDDWNTGALATFDQKWEQAFEVNETDKFTLTADQGDIVVRPNETKDRIVVTMMRRVDASSQSEARKLLANHSLNVESNEDNFRINAQLGELLTKNEKGKRIKRILFRISVPRDYHVSLDVSTGNVTLGELGGNTRIKTGLGRIETGRIGGNLDVEGRGGCIDLRAGCAGKANVLCENADVYISNVDQGKSVLKISGGNAWIGECAGKIYAQSSGGDIKVVNCTAEVGAYALDGNVDIFFDKSPTANCSFGSTLGKLTIRLVENVAAKVELSDTFDFGGMGQPVSTSDVKPGWVSRSFNDGQFTIRGKCDSGELDFKVISQTESKNVGGLGGSGLGGSGNGLSRDTNRSLRAAMKKSSAQPLAGHFTTFKVDNEVMDGYTMYLPVSYDANENRYPVLVSLGGAWTVGGDIEWVNLWGLNRLIRDEDDLSNERNKMLLDSFIVVAPHIKEGSYSKHPKTVEAIVQRVAKEFRGDLKRVYLTGLSRGGHGTWGLASKLPDLFAAIVPIAGNINDVQDGDFSTLTESAIWISHNQGDGSFPESQQAVKEIEKLTGEKFLSLDAHDVSQTEYLNQRFVFVAPNRNHHDAWTETYCRPELYKWLLNQSLSSE